MHYFFSMSINWIEGEIFLLRTNYRYQRMTSNFFLDFLRKASYNVRGIRLEISFFAGCLMPFPGCHASYACGSGDISFLVAFRC